MGEDSLLNLEGFQDQITRELKERYAQLTEQMILHGNVYIGDGEKWQLIDPENISVYCEVHAGYHKPSGAPCVAEPYDLPLDGPQAL